MSRLSVWSNGPSGGSGSVTAAGIATALGGEDSITAFATGGQASATALSSSVTNHRISVCATAGDSVALPAATVGQVHFVRNDGAAAAQVFGTSPDTINGVATATGVPLAVGQGMWFVCTTAAKWTTSFNAAVPGAIGGTTPAAGAFTTGTFSGVVKGPDGSAGAPTYSFTNAPTYGLFSLNVNDVSMSAFGSRLMAWQAGHVYVIGAGSILSLLSDTSVLKFGASDDTGLSRGGGAGILACGTGAAGSTAGSLSFTNATMAGKATTYNNVATAGLGVPAIYGNGRSTAQTAAVTSVATYTVGAADGSFIVSGNVNVTTATTHNFALQVTYTDETNAARTVTMNVQQLGGTLVTAITNVTGAGPYEGVPLHIRAKAATAITILTSGTFTTVTYNVEGNIRQIS